MNPQLKEHVTDSADGTPIGFVELGSGPSLVVVHGSLSTHDEWLPVALRLAERFTCYVMDRRGRGLSGDASGYSIDRECEDIEAVLHAAGPSAHILGHSYGATCTLETALRVRTGGLVLYEPPLPVDGPAHTKAIEFCTTAIASGRLEEALTFFFRDTLHLADGELSEMRATPLWEKMVSLVPTLAREMEAIDGLESTFERYGKLSAPTLLVVGTTTTVNHLKGASMELARTLPNARTANLVGEGHVANLSVPDLVARETADFLIRLPS